MKNIFEDAKFGDVFIGPDGAEFKFIMSDENKAVVLEEDKDSGRKWLWSYNLDGTHCGDETEVLHKADAPERQLMTEEYLLGKGFTKDFDDLLNCEYFAGPNEQITMWRNDYTNVPSPYGWFALINKGDNTRASMDIAYVDEFETFIKLCGVELSTTPT